MKKFCNQMVVTVDSIVNMHFNRIKMVNYIT
jgi:hypothetical protein